MKQRKQKILTTLLIIVILMQCAMPIFADTYNDTLKVDLDMDVKLTEGPAYINGPASKKDSSTKVDMQSTLYTKAVWDKISEYYTTMNAAYDFIGNHEMMEKLNKMKISGSFTIEIIYPAAITLPAAFISGSDMYGFNDKAKNIFIEKSRTVDTTRSDSSKTVLVIVIEVAEPLEDVTDDAAREKFVYVERFMEKYQTDYLPEKLTLEATDISVDGYGTHTVVGTFSGVTDTDGASTHLNVIYTGVQMAGGANPEGAGNDISASVTLSKGGGGGGNGGGPSGPSGNTNYTINFDIDGNKNEITPIRKVSGSTILHTELIKPHKDGYSFDGWYFDKQKTQKVTGDIKLTGNMTLYASREKSKTASKLNDIDHFAYVVGYPDGTVRPDDNISREEITTIFFRLLKDEDRNSIITTDYSFPDVEKDRWSNKSIATMENGKYITGYEDGSFRPGDYITRAEFATIATRLDDETNINASHGFTDISGHWAKNYIAAAAERGWIAGYEDGSFRADQNITRAEAMTIINRMLNRFVNAEGLHNDAILWPDNDNTSWYFYAVEEATNSHNYSRLPDGVYEKWTKLIENRDWAALEAAQ